MTGPVPSPGPEPAAGPAYPPAWRTSLVEQVAGHTVADPKRRVEDPDSDESRARLAAQADLNNLNIDDLLRRNEVMAPPAVPSAKT